MAPRPVQPGTIEGPAFGTCFRPAGFTRSGCCSGWSPTGRWPRRRSSRRRSGRAATCTSTGDFHLFRDGGGRRGGGAGLARGESTRSRGRGRERGRRRRRGRGGPGRQAGRVPGVRQVEGPRDNLPQVVTGLDATQEGIPVRVWCWPGSTADSEPIRQVKTDMRDWSLGRVIWVADRGSMPQPGVSVRLVFLGAAGRSRARRWGVSRFRAGRPGG